MLTNDKWTRRFTFIHMYTGLNCVKNWWKLNHKPKKDSSFSKIWRLPIFAEKYFVRGICLVRIKVKPIHPLRILMIFPRCFLFFTFCYSSLLAQSAFQCFNMDLVRKCGLRALKWIGVEKRQLFDAQHKQKLNDRKVHFKRKPDFCSDLESTIYDFHSIQLNNAHMCGTYTINNI